jgi:protein disulfide-isomerase A6
MDATAYPDIAQKYDIQGYPTIKFFPKGESKAPIDYEGGRTEADFVAYLNAKSGAERQTGGSLSNEAGKIGQLKPLAQKFVKSDKESARKSVLEEAKTAVKKLQASPKSPYDAVSGDIYVKTMEKIISKDKKEKGSGSKYPSTESARVNGMLSKNKDNLKADKVRKKKDSIVVIRSTV